MRLDRDDDLDVERGFDLTPLIDVVFLLLVFFLAATTFAKEEVEMDLTLPQARSGAEGQERHLLVINVRADGTLVLDGREVTLAGLEQKLAAAARRDAKQEVLIRGDTEVHFGLVAQALDLCRLATLSRISIAASPGAPRQATGGSGR